MVEKTCIRLSKDKASICLAYFFKRCVSLDRIHSKWISHPFFFMANEGLIKFTSNSISSSRHRGTRGVEKMNLSDSVGNFVNIWFLSNLDYMWQKFKILSNFHQMHPKNWILPIFLTHWHSKLLSRSRRDLDHRFWGTGKGMTGMSLSWLTLPLFHTGQMYIWSNWVVVWLRWPGICYNVTPSLAKLFQPCQWLTLHLNVST